MRYTDGSGIERVSYYRTREGALQALMILEDDGALVVRSDALDDMWVLSYTTTNKNLTGSVSMVVYE